MPVNSHTPRAVARLGAAALLATSFAAHSGSAQSIDHESFEQLLGEPVTTSATGKPQRVSEVPANMQIITAEDIKRSGADNIPDILQFVAGLNVRRYGFAAADVGVRGYNETSNPRLLVLLNGQQVYLDDLGRTQWYTLPVELEEIRQIEVVKGPNTALFGFNAASGVINIITADPLRESVNTVTARVGTQNYGAVSAVGTGKISDVAGLRLSVGGLRAREFKGVNLIPEDLAFRSNPRRASVTADLRVRVAPGVEFYAFGSAVDTRMWEATASPYFGTDYQRTNWSRVGMSADTRFGLVGVSAYRNELRYAYKGATELEDLHDTVYVLQANDVAKLGSDHTVRIGLDYRNNAAQSSRVLAGKVGYEVFSGSLMWDWQITPNLSLTNAFRYDHFVLNQRGNLFPESGLTPKSFNGRTINEPSFNSGLVWKLTERDTVRVLGGRGLQLPSIYDLGLQDRETFQGQTQLFLGQPRLNAAAVSNFELDWDRAVPALNSTVRTAIFAQRTDNMLTNPYEADLNGTGFFEDNGNETTAASASNTGHSNAMGAEVELRGHSPGGLRWNASYSYISITDHLATNQNGLFSPQDYQHGTPTHVVVAGVGHTFDRWALDLQGRWQSRFTDYSANAAQNELVPVSVGNYVSLHGRLAYKVTDNITAALTAQQYNNSRLLQSAAPPIERRLFLTLSARF